MVLQDHPPQRILFQRFLWKSNTDEALSGRVFFSLKFCGARFVAKAMLKEKTSCGCLGFCPAEN